MRKSKDRNRSALSNKEKAAIENGSFRAAINLRVTFKYHNLIVYKDSLSFSLIPADENNNLLNPVNGYEAIYVPLNSEFMKSFAFINLENDHIKRAVKGDMFEATILKMYNCVKTVYKNPETGIEETHERKAGMEKLYNRSLWDTPNKIIVVCQEDNGVMHVFFSHHLKVIK